jgi:hypothetical protein
MARKKDFQFFLIDEMPLIRFDVAQIFFANGNFDRET